MLEEIKNYYEILEVRPDASSQEVRQAYLRAKAAFGRDSLATYSLFDKQELKYLLDQIEEAYFVLSNQDKRSEYDKVHGHSIIEKRESQQNQEPSLTPPTPPPFRNENSPSTFQQNQRGPLNIYSFGKAHKLNAPFEEEISKIENLSGEFIRRTREYREVSLDQLSEFTKISKMYLQAIEGEVFSELPAPAYVRSFLVQIAKALRIPHEKGIKQFMERMSSGKKISNPTL